MAAPAPPPPLCSDTARWVCVGIVDNFSGPARAVCLDAAGPGAHVRCRGDWAVYAPGRATMRDLIERYSAESMGIIRSMRPREYRHLVRDEDIEALGGSAASRVYNGWSVEIGNKWTDETDEAAFEWLLQDLPELLDSDLALLHIDLPLDSARLARLMTALAGRSGLILTTKGAPEAARPGSPAIRAPPGVFWSHDEGGSPWQRAEKN